MIKLYDKTLKKTIDVAEEDIDDLTLLSDRYKIIKPTGQYDRHGNQLFIGDVVLQNVTGMAFHGDFIHSKILTEESTCLDDPESWVKVGSVLDN